MAPQVEIINDNEIPCELLASSIAKVADALDSVVKGPLTMRALKVLLKDVTGVPMVDIEHILTAGPRLRQAFIAQKKTK